MVGVRTRYFVSYVMPVESRFLGGDQQYTHESRVVSEHPVLWALKSGAELTFWSEIPEHVYQRARAAESERALTKKGARRG